MFGWKPGIPCAGEPDDWMTETQSRKVNRLIDKTERNSKKPRKTRKPGYYGENT